MQLCWKPAKERPTMTDVLQRLENLRDDIARNTPSSRKRKSILSHSPKITPNTTPPNRTPNTTPIAVHAGPHPKGTTPTEPHPKRVTPDSHSKRPMPAATPTEPHPKKATPTTKPHPKSYAPRRPAPKAPGEESLKRGSNDATQHQHVPNDAHHQQEIPNGAHQHQQIPNGAQHVRAGEMEKQPSNEPAAISEHNRVTSAMGITNPGFAEVERKDEGGITGATEEEMGAEFREERDVEEGVLFVNRAAEGEVEEEDVKGTEEEVKGTEEEVKEPTENRGGGEWDLEDGQEWGDEDFILDPPIDFSQPGMEDDDLPPDVDNPNESLCTSIDDFEPIPEPLTSPNAPPKEQARTDSFATGRKGPAHNVSSTARDRVDSKSKKKQKKEGKKGRRERRRERGDGTQASPLLTYRTRGEIQPQVIDRGTGGEVREGWKEPDFEEKEEGEDSRYRKPTGQISKALLKRAPSWSRSGHSEGEDKLPNVVYDDDVSALLW